MGENLRMIEKDPMEKVRKDKKVLDEPHKIDEFELSKLVPKVKAFAHKPSFYLGLSAKACKLLLMP